ncbi:MAG: hypothetical protein J2O39_10795, partial [Acidimicrobiales bacterium]|nr:hypothetical protein [Acidimicrobiales bacterium]
LRRGAGALAAVLSLGLAAGCTASRNVLGTGDSACFQAIPVAADAVGHRGRLVGVHRVKTERLEHLLHTVPQHPHQAVCIVAYRGSFSSEQVTLAPPGRTGRYAVVVVSSPGNHLVRSYVLEKLPLPFRHL